MRRGSLLHLIATVLLWLAFNALWLLHPSLTPSQFVETTVLVNAGFAAIVVARFLRSRRTASELSSLRRQYLRLEFRSEDRERQARVLESISTLSSAFLDNVGVQTLLGQMSEAVHSILAVDTTVIEVLPDVEKEMEPITLSVGAEIHLGPEIHRDVVGRGKSILINDIGHYPRYAALHAQGLTAMLVAPFKRDGNVIGLLGAFARSNRSFTGGDLDVLHTFATHTTLLLEGATLLDAVRQLSVRRTTEQIDSLRHLHTQIRAERDQADREAAVARRIQRELLPQSFPRLLHVALDGLTLPARDVGGDFFDVIPLAAGQWGIAVADVSGKGVGAALVMVMTHTLLRAIATACSSPSDALVRLNRELFDQTTGDVFVSMFYGIWDDGTRTLRYANAGHEPPVLVRGADAQLLPRGGIALGAIGAIDTLVADHAVQLAPSDALVLYTDGVREAMNDRHQMYGTDRLAAAVRHAVANAQPLIAALRSDVSAYVADAEQHDDITLLTLQAQ